MTITNTTIADLVGDNGERKLAIKVDAIRTESNELVTSGLTATTAEVTALASGGPRKVTLDYVKPLSTDVFNVTSDDINDEGDVGNQEAASFGAHRVDLNYGWATSDLTQIVTQYGSTGDLASGIAGFQNAISKSLLASTLTGVRASVASNALVVKQVSTDFDMAVAYDLIATAEEWSSLFNGAMVSWGRYAKLQAGNANDFVPASETNTGFAQYQGFNLLRTNKLGDNDMTFFRTGALGYGEGTVQKAIEVERKANGGNGGGADILHSRFSRVFAPQGMDYKGDIAKTQADVKAFLEAAASWTLVAPEAQFGFRFVTFNHA
ncbi:hypothetical protein [Sphingomonas oryzagri]